MSTYQCPGCKKVRVNGHWVDLNTVGPEDVVSDFVDYLCRTCRDDKQLRAELLNEGVDIPKSAPR